MASISLFSLIYLKFQEAFYKKSMSSFLPPRLEKSQFNIKEANQTNYGSVCSGLGGVCNQLGH